MTMRLALRARRLIGVSSEGHTVVRMATANSHRDRVPQLLCNRPNQDVDVIIVTDGERILGIGDQGAGGPRHPDRQALAMLGDRGIHPARTLPIVLDAAGSASDQSRGVRAAPTAWRIAGGIAAVLHP
jgi:malic enzyme